MKSLRSFHSSKPSGEDFTRVDNCLCSIKNKISEQSGVSDFLEYENGGIAFSGTRDKPELFFNLSILKSEGKFHLSADIDDEISWYEWNYESQEEFENEIVKYIAPMINRTIKTVTEKKKHKYLRYARYYLSDNNEWILIDEDIIDSFIVKLFLFKDSLKEDINEYHLGK